jgi:hypothetical protein
MLRDTRGDGGGEWRDVAEVNDTEDRTDMVFPILLRAGDLRAPCSSEESITSAGMCASTLSQSSASSSSICGGLWGALAPTGCRNLVGEGMALVFSLNPSEIAETPFREEYSEPRKFELDVSLTGGIESCIEDARDWEGVEGAPALLSIRDLLDISARITAILLE